MPDAWIALVEALFLLGFAFSVGGLLWTRDKPRDWLPPAWYRAGYFGPMLRTRFRLNCWIGVVGFPVFAVLVWVGGHK